MTLRHTGLALLLLTAVACGDDGDGDRGEAADTAAASDGGDTMGDSSDAGGLEDTDPSDATPVPTDTPTTDTALDGGDGSDARPDAPDDDVPPLDALVDAEDVDVDAAMDGTASDVADGDAALDAPTDSEVDAPEPDATLACRGSGDAPFEMALGTGIDRFEPLEDGDTVIMAEGIQGGFHIWGGLSGTGFDPEDGVADFRLRNAAEEVVGALVWTGDYRCDATTGRWYGAGLTVFLDFAVWPPEVDGERWSMCVETTLGSGETFSDCVEVVTSCCDWLFGPPDDA
jgi:hypothetical protein